MNKYLYLEAPNYLIDKIDNWRKTVFLAGSISNARDWQEEAAKKLSLHFNIFNPRRTNYTNFDIEEERAQIQWEFTYLNQASIILFWFSNETLAPITLLELGALLEQSKITPWKKIYIGIHPEYKRKNDVIIQTELRNPQFARNIFDSLEALCGCIILENC